MIGFLREHRSGMGQGFRQGNAIRQGENQSRQHPATERTGWVPMGQSRQVGVPIRVKGVDAPELRGECQTETVKARKAKQFTVARLRAARQIRLDGIERGKYFRLLADVYVDGESLGQALILAGHARRYDGGTRVGWCG